MRLSAKEVAAIRDAVAAVFGDGAQVFLYGSRADDTQRGGDIDLLVEVGTAAEADLSHELALKSALEDRLGERHIDVLLTVRGEPPAGPMARIAYATGVAL